MLVVHPLSRCDVCLDEYSFATPEHTPHAISCGHIFCYLCLTRLIPSNCPLCRKSFTRDRIRRLHVDRPSPSDTEGTPGTPGGRGFPSQEFREEVGLMQRIAFVSGESAPDEDVAEVVEEVRSWLNGRSDDSHRPLRNSLLALIRHKELQDEHRRSKVEQHNQIRIMKNKLNRAENDLKMARTVEQSLLEQVQNVGTQYNTRLEGAQAELNELRSALENMRSANEEMRDANEEMRNANEEMRNASKIHDDTTVHQVTQIPTAEPLVAPIPIRPLASPPIAFYSSNNPLPPPPKDIGKDWLPSLLLSSSNPEKEREKRRLHRRKHGSKEKEKEKETKAGVDAGMHRYVGPVQVDTSARPGNGLGLLDWSLPRPGEDLFDWLDHHRNDLSRGFVPVNQHQNRNQTRERRQQPAWSPHTVTNPFPHQNQNQNNAGVGSGRTQVKANVKMSEKARGKMRASTDRPAESGSASASVPAGRMPYLEVQTTSPLRIPDKWSGPSSISAAVDPRREHAPATTEALTRLREPPPAVDEWGFLFREDNTGTGGEPLRLNAHGKRHSTYPDREYDHHTRYPLPHIQPQPASSNSSADVMRTRSPTGNNARHTRGATSPAGIGGRRLRKDFEEEDATLPSVEQRRRALSEEMRARRASPAYESDGSGLELTRPPQVMRVDVGESRSLEEMLGVDVGGRSLGELLGLDVGGSSSSAAARLAEGVGAERSLRRERGSRPSTAPSWGAQDRDTGVGANTYGPETSMRSLLRGDDDLSANANGNGPSSDQEEGEIYYTPWTSMALGGVGGESRRNSQFASGFGRSTRSPARVGSQERSYRPHSRQVEDINMPSVRYQVGPSVPNWFNENNLNSSANPPLPMPADSPPLSSLIAEVLSQRRPRADSGFSEAQADGRGGWTLLDRSGGSA